MLKLQTKQKRRATLLLLLGLLWVMYTGFAFSSPYVSRLLWEAFHTGWLVNVVLLLTCIAFWSWLLVLGCVWLGTPRLSRGAQYCWWAVTMLSQCGWVYLVL